MSSNPRNRVPGSSEHKKGRFGRKKKQPRVFRGTYYGPGASSTTGQTSAALQTTSATSGTTSDTLPSTSGTSRLSDRPQISRFSQKLQLKSVDANNVQNRIIDISIFFQGLKEFLVCQACHGKVTFSEIDIRGLGSKVSVTCTACYKVTFIDTSRKVGSKSNAYEINKRSLLAARTLGHELTGLKTFCGVMDLPPPISHSNFDVINKDLKIASEQVAKESMTAAIEEDCGIAGQEDSAARMTVSGDGSWRKRGHSSLQGVSSLIRFENGKVIDVAPKQSFCKSCELHPEENTEEYREWFQAHEKSCSANHTGSSGKMEVDGILEMFKRSESTYGVRYENYIGDGDAKVYKSVCDAKPYGEDFTINKKECIQHVQKRMGTRLRNLKSQFAGKNLSDNKTIGGRGRLTAQAIDQLTRYYGNAIRGHNDSVDKMSNAIWATFYHKLSTDCEPQHHLCPTGVSSWCKWQKAKANNKLKKFKHSSSIPAAIMTLLKPIYTDLTKPELLERCIGGFTQNSNESFNQSIWKLIPKQLFSGLTVLEIGVYIAVICFNDGKTAFIEVMNRFGVQPGSSAVTWARNTDEDRLIIWG